MQVLLLEKIKSLGNVGDLVTVKNGYARNYLLIKNKALRATQENKNKFEAQRKLIEENNALKKKKALENNKKINGKNIIIVSQAGEDSRLYGSVNNKAIVKVLASDFNVSIPVESIILRNKIKEIGFHYVEVNLHPDIETRVRVIVARSQEEAKNMLKQESKKEEKDVKSAKKIVETKIKKINNKNSS